MTNETTKNPAETTQDTQQNQNYKPEQVVSIIQNKEGGDKHETGKTTAQIIEHIQEQYEQKNMHSAALAVKLYYYAIMIDVQARRYLDVSDTEALKREGIPVVVDITRTDENLYYNDQKAMLDVHTRAEILGMANVLGKHIKNYFNRLIKTRAVELSDRFMDADTLKGIIFNKIGLDNTIIEAFRLIKPEDREVIRNLMDSDKTSEKEKRYLWVNTLIEIIKRNPRMAKLEEVAEIFYTLNDISNNYGGVMSDPVDISCLIKIFQELNLAVLGIEPGVTNIIKESIYKDCDKFSPDGKYYD